MVKEAALPAPATEVLTPRAAPARIQINDELSDSMTNIIVVESTRGQVEIGFWDYARLGIPVTILTIVVGTIILLLLG